jgi:drug/metabolite transporter (DMT)-like permease
MIRIRRGAAARPPQTISESSSTERATPSLIWLALSSVYVIWGGTYLAIRVADRTIPPFFMAGFRFLVAGGLMYAWSIRRGDREGDRPDARQWRSATIIGAFLLLGGNGAVVWAEKRIPSGIAALLVATAPLWMALLDRILNGQRLSPLAVAGLVVGFGGVGLLVGNATRGRFDLAGMLVVLGGALAWAIGSLYTRQARLPARAMVGTSMEMLTGGALLMLASLASGELSNLHPSQFSGESLWGLAYLIVAGSWIGFASYAWLIRVAPVSLVGTYAYVNPVVAVFLGWAILSEVITGRTILAGAVIVVGVAMIILARPRAAAGDAAEAVGGEPRTLRDRLTRRAAEPQA